MALVLRVLVAGDCSISEGETRVCAGSSFTIGRGVENDWVVIDPQRHLSKQHCRIELRGQTYFVIDTSTNGVYVGGAATPLGRGNAQPVNDGDVINLGPCTLRLEIEEQVPATLGGGQDGVASIATPLTGGTLSDPEIDYTLAGLNGDGPNGGGLNGRTGYGASLTQVLAGDSVGELQLTDMLGEREGEVEPAFGGVLALAPSLAAAHTGTGAYFEAPEVKHPVIPVDWQAEAGDGAVSPQDELGSVSTAAQLMTEAFTGARDGRAMARLTGAASAAVNGGATILPINPPTVQARPQPAPAPVAGAVNAATVAMPAPAPVIPQPAPAAQAVAPQPVAPAPAAAAPTPAAAQIPTDVFEAFLAGVGLPLDAVDTADAPALMHKMGVALREAVGGLRELLELRAFLKSEFRIEHTLLRAKENNPLKFSANLEGTLAVLIGRRVMGFMDAPEAIRESLRDIKAHEVALIAGMKTVVGDVLEQLSPDTIKSDVSTSVLPQVHKARCWERYEQIHQRMIGEQSSGPPLGSKFSAAYTQQFRNI
ncbi:type VI secretion system-associated FHA domain protein TagH [Nitrospirillum iridis]|uniref:Type VI secretion system FHA domain protein n=1 Tax=Nitrospirillum iridis TaxID=765888 RepID=A0A7X0B2W8_9PROT|nr:type VI secretion system-associated FHA domain protein TagH [Nitrospirillum iridis]MBB6253224.1 type VI secretion system FHA domain protein [Nitrospirillum iridis]